MNIKDYIHHYIGCEVTTPDHIVRKLIGVEGDAAITYGKYGRCVYSIKDTKPILRPLSDMTEEEAVALVFAAEGAKADFVQWHTESGEIGGKPFGFEWISDHYRKGQRHNTWYESFEPEGTRYLLSRGFDLFGLIQAGLALDKTTYQSPKIQQP